MDDKTRDVIKSHIDNNEVCLFMKGTPDAPQCGFSMAVTNLLKILEVNFKAINVLEDQSIREGVKTFRDIFNNFKLENKSIIYSTHQNNRELVYDKIISIEDFKASK